MKLIQEQTWDEVIKLTWSELSPHQWMDFRSTLSDTITEQQVTGMVLSTGSSTATTETILISTGVVVEHNKVLMTTRTQLITNIVVSERNYIQSMVKCMPMYERPSTIMGEIITSYDREFRALEQSLVVVNRNLFIDSAVESLPLHERDLGIETLNQLTYDQRREQIMAQYMAAFDQTTEVTIKQVASAYGNGEVDIYPTSTPGVYVIEFVGIGIPNNLDGLKKTLSVILPAHIQIEYEFRFNTWSNINHLTWATVKDMTWEEVRETEGVV